MCPESGPSVLVTDVHRAQPGGSPTSKREVAMKVLVTAASRHGATAELATEIGVRLRETRTDEPIAVDIRPVGDVETLAG